MITNMQTIFQTINHYNPELYLSAKEYSSINDIDFIYENQNSFKENTIYICEPSALNTILNLSTPINLLCIADKQSLDELMNNENVNLIVISSGHVDILQLYNEINEFIIDRRYVIEGSLKISNALISRKGIQYIVDIGSDIIENPVKVTDIGLKNLASTQKYDVNDPIWNEVMQKGFTDIDLAMELQVPEQLQEIYSSNLPVYIKLNPHRWMATRIMIDQTVVGHIAAVEYLRPFKKRDEEILQYLSTVMSCMIPNNNKTYESLIFDLLDGDLKNPEIIKERAKSINYKLRKNFRVIVLQPRQVIGKYTSFLHLGEIMEKMIRDSKAVFYKNEIVLIINSEDKINSSTINQEALMIILKDHQMRGGISPNFHSIADIREHYILALKAIELGARIDYERVIFPYEDYTDYHLINLAASQIDLKHCCNPKLFDLMKYDSIYNSSYTESLYVYLFTGNKSSISAQIFNIHRNSMDYRIKKIEEILDVKLSDPNISLSFVLSFKILIYTGEISYHQQYKIDNTDKYD